MTVTAALITLGVIIVAAIVLLFGTGFYSLHRMTRDDEPVTELNEEQADRRRLDEIVRELER